jgi:transposase
MPGGRPSKLSGAVTARLVEAIRAGNYLETAAAYAGIDKATLHRWLKRGRRSERGPLREFCASVEKALADAEVRDVALIGKAAAEQWQAAAWRLERKFPDRWGRRQRHEIVGVADEPPVRVELGHLSDDELGALEKILQGDQ